MTIARLRVAPFLKLLFLPSIILDIPLYYLQKIKQQVEKQM